MVFEPQIPEPRKKPIIPICMLADGESFKSKTAERVFSDAVLHLDCSLDHPEVSTEVTLPILRILEEFGCEEDCPRYNEAHRRCTGGMAKSRCIGPAWKTPGSLGHGATDGNLEDHPVAEGKHWQSSARMLRKRAQHEL